MMACPLAAKTGFFTSVRSIMCRTGLQKIIKKYIAIGQVPCYNPSLPLGETKTEPSEAPLLLYIAEKQGNTRHLRF